MNQYCEVKLVNVLTPRKTTAVKLNYASKYDGTKLLAKESDLAKRTTNRLVHTNREIVGGKNEDKRATRSSGTFLITSQSQHYLVKPCNKNVYGNTAKADKLPKTCNENNLHRQQKRTKKRQCSNEIEDNKSRGKIFKLEAVSEIVDNCKNIDVTFNRNSSKKKKVTKRKNSLKMFCESKLTGARRVSKRLSNLRTKNKTDTKAVNSQSVIVKKFNENISMVKKPRAKRFLAKKATYNKHAGSTDKKDKMKVSTSIENQPKQQKYRKSSQNTKQPKSKTSSDNKVLVGENMNKNSSTVNTALPVNTTTKELCEQEDVLEDVFIEENNGKDCFSICSVLGADVEIGSDRTTDLNGKEIGSNIVPIHLNSEDNANVNQVIEESDSSFVPNIKNDDVHTTEVVLLESEEIKYVDDAEVIVVALEPIKDEAVLVDETLVECCQVDLEKQQSASQLFNSTTNINSDHESFDLSETTDQQPETNSEEEKALINPEDDTFCKENK